MLKKDLTSSGSNNSTSGQLDKKLQKIRFEGGGTISYVFISERIDKEGNVIHNRSFLHSSINPEVFFKMEGTKKVRRSNDEVLEVFESIKADLGANELIID